MKQQILKKIDEMCAENSRLWCKLNQAMIDGHYDYDSEEYGGDFSAGGYDGDSLSHMLDILDEQDYALKKLADFIQSLEE